MAHGWPSLTFLPSQDAATAASVSRPGYVAQQLAFLGGAIVLVGAGLHELWRDPRLRALAVLAPVTSLLFLVEQGRSYYALPAVVMPLAAGAVAAERWWARARRRRAIAVAAPVVVLQLMALVLAAPLVWPVLPTATMVASGDWSATYYKDELGWPELAAETGRAWRSLPVTQRAQTVLLAVNYGEAGALELYGPSDVLPPPSAATCPSNTGGRSGCRSAGRCWSASAPRQWHSYAQHPDGHRQRGARPDDRRLRATGAARAPMGLQHRPRHALGSRVSDPPDPCHTPWPQRD